MATNVSDMSLYSSNSSSTDQQSVENLSVHCLDFDDLVLGFEETKRNIYDLSDATALHVQDANSNKGHSKRHGNSGKSKSHHDKTDLEKQLLEGARRKVRKTQKRDKTRLHSGTSSRSRLRSSEDDDVSAASSSEVVLLREQLTALSSELVSLRTSIAVKTANGTTNGCHDGLQDAEDLGDFIVGSEQQSGLSAVNGKAENTASIVKRKENKIDLEDLIHLYGPLTEDSILKTLQHRWNKGCCYTKIGPILLSLNPYKGTPIENALHHGGENHPYLLNVVKDAVRLQTETGCSQAIVLSGESGSGKTYSSLLLLRQLFDVAGGGPGTDAFKHVSAAVTVLRSLGTAKTVHNSESSRMGYYTEVHVTEGVIFRTKIHCYFVDETRVIQTSPHEKGYHIFYHMLSGLSQDERVKLHLQGYSSHNLKYLNHLLNVDVDEDCQKFQVWKSSLQILGIPFSDVMRILAAIMLLGNIEFVESDGLELDIKGNNEIKAVAALLGVSGVSLYRGLTTRTRNMRGQIFKSPCDAPTANTTRDNLARALYCRTVSAITRKANSLRRPGSNSGHSSSSDDVHHSGENQNFKHPSPATSKLSVNQSSSASTHCGGLGDGIISIVDMFGFENTQNNQFEQLCSNLCSETLQHYYNIHVFKSTQECCRDEGIPCEVDLDYQDNTPVIELISAPLTGIFHYLDKESANMESKSTCASFVQNIGAQHSTHDRFFIPEERSTYNFGIVHYVSSVVYSSSNMVERNRDIVGDDIINIFQRQNCNFGFATHLFTSELKEQNKNGGIPKGNYHRILPSPSSYSDTVSGNGEGRRTFSQDFQSRLDNLLKTLMHAKPHFVLCIRPNYQEAPSIFDLNVVRKQIRALQILETVHLMAGGYPHKMRFRSFNHRYKFLSRHKRLRRSEEKAIEDTKAILDSFLKALDDSKMPYTSTNWAMGKRHIFLSEGARQSLEHLRYQKREEAATVIQSHVRKLACLKNWPSLKRTLEQKLRIRTQNHEQLMSRRSPMYQEIERSRKRVIENESCDIKTIQQTCYLYGLDMDSPPPLPSSRSYTVTGNMKMGFPQCRVMKHSFPEGSGEKILRKGELVQVTGVSPRRGHLMIEHKDNTLHVPYQLTEIKALPR
ncbi:unconventional myosin-X-like [Saccoglossus kowalevskii]